MHESSRNRTSSRWYCTQVYQQPAETLLWTALNGGEDYPSTASRGSCPEPKHLSMSFHLNQISIFMSGRCKHWVRNQYNLKRSGCILAQMGLYPDPLKLPQIAFRGFLFTLFCASHRACQKIVQPPLIFTAYLILWLSPTSPFLFVPDGRKNETWRHWERGCSREARRAAEERGKGRGPLCIGRMGLGALFSDQHMCVSLWQSIGEGV